MNLNDERNYQMCQGALDAMNLSSANRKLADEYLDIEHSENVSLLEKAEHQDFSLLDEDSKKKCVDYVEHLLKRSRTEDLVRYTRFCAQVGGSTARYVMFNQWMCSLSGPRTTTIKDALSPEQEAAIQAELIVWNQSFYLGNILRDMVKACKEQPEAYHKAMDLCYHQKGNAKTLLASIYLHTVKPSASEKGGILKALLSKPEKEVKEGVSDVVSYLSDTLVSSVPNMLTDSQKLTDVEKEKLNSFLLKADADAPIDGEISLILQKAGLAGTYLTRLLVGAAFLAIEHSDRFLLFVRFAMYVNLKETLDTCKNVGGGDWLSEHLELLEKALTVKPEEYGRWCISNRVILPMQRMAKTNPDAIQNLLPSLSTTEYQFLLEEVKKGNPTLYQQLNTSFDEEFRTKLASELTSRFQTGKTEAAAYLLGRAEIKDLDPFVDDWQNYKWALMTWNDHDKIAKLRDGSDVAMFHRVVALEAITGKANFCTSKPVFPHSGGGVLYNYNKVVDKKQILAILDILEQEHVPVDYQLKFMEAIHDYYYSESQKTSVLNECATALREKKEAWTEEFTNYAVKGSALVRYLCIRVLDAYWSEFKEVLLSCATDSSKQVRELLVNVYASHKEWEPEIASMLASKKSQERELAVQVLGKWGVEAYREQLEKALETEKSKKIKDQIMSVLGMEVSGDGQGQPGSAGPQSTEQLAAELLKGGKKRKVEWANDCLLTKVHKLDGTEASEDYLCALLVAYADKNVPGVSPEAARLAAELDPKELAAFMGLLFSKWMELGAEAKKKWVLYAASIHGGDTIVPTLHHQIQVWPEAARGAIAAEAVKALALNGTSTALLLVDQISRKFKNRQVKAAGGEALTYAAEQLGITRAELEDRIVPSLDFDENQERHFDFGSRSFRVRLTPALELEIFDESGKKLKNLPSPGKQDDEEKAKAASEAFKLMKKQLKTVVTNQKLRLEQALSTERLWPADKWQELFVRNPIMHQFAIGLVWGVYEQGSQMSSVQASDSGSPTAASARGIVLKDTFRYMEDGTFNTVDEEEYELSEGAKIGLVHPVELDNDTLSAWKEQLSDYEVTQPFDQLDRPVYRITEEEKKEKELSRFGGVLLNSLSLSGKLLGQGWFRGPVEDAGVFCTYYRNDGANGAELEFSGAAVGYEFEEVTVYGIYFYPSGEAAQGGYQYQKDYEKKRCLLSEVSPRYFSEIILMLTRATASSQEKLPYPECKDTH